MKNRSTLVVAALLACFPGSWAGERRGEDPTSDGSDLTAETATGQRVVDRVQATTGAPADQAGPVTRPESVVMRPIILSSDPPPAADCQSPESDADGC